MVRGVYVQMASMYIRLPPYWHVNSKHPSALTRNTTVLSVTLFVPLSEYLTVCTFAVFQRKSVDFLNRQQFRLIMVCCMEVLHEVFF